MADVVTRTRNVGNYADGDGAPTPIVHVGKDKDGNCWMKDGVNGKNEDLKIMEIFWWENDFDLEKCIS
jgi:hypothetical protein